MQIGEGHLVDYSTPRPPVQQRISEFQDVQFFNFFGVAAPRSFILDQQILEDVHWGMVHSSSNGPGAFWTFHASQPGYTPLQGTPPSHLFTCVLYCFERIRHILVFWICSIFCGSAFVHSCHIYIQDYR